MTSTNSSTQAAAAAAKRILGFYDSIPATDQKSFTTGLVEMLSGYPPLVLDRAASPSRGLAAFVAYPNLARFKERLDVWYGEHLEHVATTMAKRIEADPKRRSPPPVLIPLDTPGRLANIFVPAGHHRYAALCEWAKTAEKKWWRYGKASDGREGIWIPLSEWQTATDTIGAGARQAVRAAQPMNVDTSSAEDVA